jgi:valyl-tRNA synthetase
VRHNLSHEVIVINEFAKMTVTGRLEGKKVSEARDLVVEWIRSEGLLEKEEEIVHNVATAERTGGVVEPLPKLQWFIGVDTPFTMPHSDIPGITSGQKITLKALMRQAVESNAVEMPQEGFRNAYFHWIDNLRDWCISRQIWFGHRIPVWYGGEEIHVGEKPPTSEGWTQDPDVLDTWFSSALWTFSTLGWPEETSDLATFHPTSFMSPAYEILNLWVSRMILMSGFHVGQVPFRKVMIHGLVRDKQGRKFSKSLNNGIDPLDMIDSYGADALRMGLLVGASVGSDISFDESRVKGYKHFANKLWNITRFVLDNTAGAERTAELTEADAALLRRADELTEDITKDMEEVRVYMAAEKIYHYAWHELADKILEESKPILSGTDAAAASRRTLLRILLDRTIRLLHPFMPFVTEEIYQSMPSKTSEFLMIEKWPSAVR